MVERTAPTSQVDEIVDAARRAEEAIKQLNRATIERPTLLPADVDVALAHLSGMAAALPQAASQLAEMLGSAAQDLDLSMDSLTAGSDPILAIDTARLHLEAVREPAVELFRGFDGAHSQIAHIASVPPREDSAPTAAQAAGPSRRHVESQEPPSVRPDGPGPTR